MKKHGKHSFTSTLLLLCVITFYPAQVMGATQVQVMGDSKYYYGAGLGRDNAVDNANRELSEACRKKGMILYEGKRLKSSMGYHRYSNSNYGELDCKRSGKKEKCTIKVTGTCMSADSQSFNVTCKSGKRAYARIEPLPMGALRIITMNGTALTLSSDTVKDTFQQEKTLEDSTPSIEPEPVQAGNKDPFQNLVSSMCQGERDTGAIDYLKKKMRRYAKNKHRELVARCKKLRKDKQTLPEECTPRRIKMSNPGGVRG